jgi:hypothetical protein
MRRTSFVANMQTISQCLALNSVRPSRHSSQPPPRESLAEIVPPASSQLRIGIGPDVIIALGPRVKHPDEGVEGQDVVLILIEQEWAFIPPYQRPLDDAMRGIGGPTGTV